MGTYQILQGMKSYLKTLYGSQKQCASELGVTTATVQNWIKRTREASCATLPRLSSTRTQPSPSSWGRCSSGSTS